MESLGAAKANNWGGGVFPVAHTRTLPIMGVHIFFWKREFFRAAQVEKVESLGVAKAKNRGGGGGEGGGFQVAHTRIVPILE